MLNGEVEFFFKRYLDARTSIRRDDGLFVQANMQDQSAFENAYLNVRKSEGRILADDVVKKLPGVDSHSPHRAEWRARNRSATKLCDYLRRQTAAKILEVGCGNGWLIHRISTEMNVDCCGVDINSVELKQAASIFGDQPNLSFVHADIGSDIFDGAEIDIIILASAIQYFPNPSSVITTLKKKLSNSGEIHIIDTKFYSASQVNEAKERSYRYFESLDAEEMSAYYFHHSLESLQPHAYEILYDPARLSSKILRKLGLETVFSWIVVPK